MQRGDHLTLTIERPAAGGRMIARHDGAVVLVAGAIPGETVEAVVEKMQRGMVWAAVTRLIEASPDRVEITGDPRCGGCAFAHVRYDRQLELKRAIVDDALRRLGHITLERPVDVAPSPAEGYRMRAHLRVARGQVGFVREGTHELCDPAPTGQLRADTLDAVVRLTGECERLHAGSVSGVIVSENIGATERACHAELSAGTGAHRLAALPPIAGIAGVSCAPADHLRARDLWGSPRVSDTLAVTASDTGPSVVLVRQARAFFQGNRFLLRPLLLHVIAQIEEGPVLDLYAGVGLFSVAASAAGCGPVVAVEGDPVAVSDLRANAAHCAGRLDVRAQSVEDFVRAPRLTTSPATVIADPPRTGLSPAALSAIVALRASRLIYVSCDIATLARDARRIRDAGYAIAGTCAFDLFPNTPHVECVMVFAR